MIAGFPARLIEHEPGQYRSTLLRFPIDLAQLACKQERPAFSQLAAFEIQVPDDRLVSDRMNPDRPPAPLPDFGGVSGGPCWSLTPSNGSDPRRELVALHVGSGNSSNEFYSRTRVLREMPISYHLRLIAEDYPDLRENIYKRFPTLESVDLDPKEPITRFSPRS